MKIQPYTSVDSLLFGESTKAESVALYGEPTRTSKNRDGREECHYNSFILRFDGVTGALCECTLLPYATAKIGALELTWDLPFLRQACQLDGEPVDIYGFIVMRNIGLAVTGVHDHDEGQLAVTAFSRGDFDDLMSGAKPFDPATLILRNAD